MQDRIAPVQAAFDTERARWRGPSANCRLQVCSMNYAATHVAALATNGFFRKCRNGKSGINLSKLNPTPHAIAVYASQQLSPAGTQHSLPSGRYSLLGPDFHRLDRTSLRLAHSFDHLVGAGEERKAKVVRLSIVRFPSL